MKRDVYVVNSLKQDDFIIFGTRKRAEEWIEHFNEKIFNKSTKSDLYIVSQIVF